MTDKVLLARLRPAVDRLRRFRMLAGFAAGWALAAVIAAALLRMNPVSSEWYASIRFWVLPCGLLLGILGGCIGRLCRPRARAVAAHIERMNPDLDGRLSTALEQAPDENGRFHFLQDHLFTETIHHSTQQDWSKIVSPRRMGWTRAAEIGALAAFVGIWFLLPQPLTTTAAMAAAGGAESKETVTVTPGDTELEKGSTLVLLARFNGTVPGSADVVIGDTAASEQRLPLKRNLNDPVFGGTVPDVAQSFTYRVVWENGESQRYKVQVFEFPKLERSDVTLTYPEYTKLPVKRIEDMRHTSAVEGTRIDLDLTLNKPVVSAVLEPKKAKNAKEDANAPPALKLEAPADKAVATLRGFVPPKSVRYELVLTDADGRRSRQAVPFSFDVLPNKIPEMKLTAPKGDQKPSALQELLFTGTVWDDFGVVASGLEVTTPGGETVTLDFGKDITGRETRAFQQLLRFEEMNAVPDQLFAWHVWTDDIGPDGKVRRTRGDLFYGEIRPFEEVFRQGDGAESGQQQSQEQQQNGQQQGGGPATKLAELQKQIINATWKLQRQTSGKIPDKIADDIKTVHDSQEDAEAQAEEAAGEAAETPQAVANWQVVVQQMKEAIQRLETAAVTPPEISKALAPEQAAYQALLKLRAHEYDVTRSNRRQQQQRQQGGQQQNGGTQRQQEQLDQLDLAKEENRYETQREAQAQQSAERREQMQVMNRLKELAQRQQDVNEKLKELQTALNEAKTEKEKEEVQRQLKRLEEEQRRMLADADELSQRMEQRQNQSEAGEQQQKLDEARQNMEQAAEATSRGETGEALASGSRAQEQMQEMREELRKQSAGAFSEELRQMRAEARDIARKQEEIAQQMKKDQPAKTETADSKAEPKADPAAPKPEPGRREAPSLGGGDKEEGLVKALDQQQERTNDLVKRATELSEQAEPSEPLLSRQIYETARQFSQDDAGAVKQTQQEMLKEGRLTESQFDEMKRLQETEQAGKTLRLASRMLQRNQQEDAARTGERARQDLDRLRQGVERAAESVLGDDTAAIRLAESQLQAAADAVQKEIEQQQKQDGEASPNGQQPRQGQRENNSQANAGTPREGQPQQGSQPGQNEGRQPNEQQPGQERNQVAQNGERPQDGQAQRNGRGQQQPGQNQEPQQGQRQGRGQGQQPGEQQPRENGELAQEQNQNQSQEQNQNQEQNSQPQEGQGQGGGRGRQPGEVAQEQNREQSGQPQEGQPGAQPGQESPSDQDRDGARTAQNRRGPRELASNNGGGGGGGPQEDYETRRFNGNRPVAPLTGEGFTNWSDSLREAEEMIDQADLRNGIASARERARLMRQEMKRDLKKPDWAVVELQILKPLVEVRQRLREELARRDSDKALVPVDRDPVPAQFSENVRRYYEQLGRDK
jgi:hypothetical protein